MNERSDDKHEKPLPPVQVPLEALSEEILSGIIDNFIQREGTDYGAQEAAYSSKVSQIERQLKRGDVVIAFDPESESVSLVTKNDWKRFSEPSL